MAKFIIPFKEDREVYPHDSILSGLEIEKVIPYRQSYGGEDDCVQVFAHSKEHNRRVVFKISYKSIREVLQCCDYRVEYTRAVHPMLRDAKLTRNQETVKEVRDEQ